MLPKEKGLRELFGRGCRKTVRARGDEDTEETRPFNMAGQTHT